MLFDTHSNGDKSQMVTWSWSISVDMLIHVLHNKDTWAYIDLAYATYP